MDAILGVLCFEINYEGGKFLYGIVFKSKKGYVLMCECRTTVGGENRLFFLRCLSTKGSGSSYKLFFLCCLEIPKES